MHKIYLIFFIPLIAFANGDKLYKQYCEKCHGLNHNGSIGLPLSSEKLKYMSNDYIKNTIRFGRPGRVMPKFNLNDEGSNQLIKYLRQNSKAPKYSNEVITGNIKNGKKNYNKYCSSCHNIKLTGGVGIGKNYSWNKEHKVSPPALANIGFLKSINDNELKFVIQNGRINSEMVAFKNILTDIQTNDIVSYIRSFQKNSPKIAIDLGEPSIVFKSTYNLEQTINKLQNSIKAANYRVYAPKKLLEDLSQNKDVSKQIVIRFCNFERMQEFIKIEPRLGIVLPCRITVIENEKAQVSVVIENYLRTVNKFNNTQITQAAEELILELGDIIEEALW